MLDLVLDLDGVLLQLSQILDQGLDVCLRWLAWQHLALLLDLLEAQLELLQFLLIIVQNLPDNHVDV